MVVLILILCALFVTLKTRLQHGRVVFLPEETYFFWDAGRNLVSSTSGRNGKNVWMKCVISSGVDKRLKLTAPRFMVPE